MAAAGAQVRAGENLVQVEENGTREKRMSSRARCKAELTGIGVGLNLEHGDGEPSRFLVF